MSSWSTPLLVLALPVLLGGALHAQAISPDHEPGEGAPDRDGASPTAATDDADPLGTAPSPPPAGPLATAGSQPAQATPPTGPQSAPGGLATLPAPDARPSPADPAPPGPTALEPGVEVQPAPSEPPAPARAPAAAKPVVEGNALWQGALVGCALGSFVPCAGLCLGMGIPFLGLGFGGPLGLLAAGVAGMLIGEYALLSAGICSPAGTCLGGIHAAQRADRSWVAPMLGALPGVLLGGLAGAGGMLGLTWTLVSIIDPQFAGPPTPGVDLRSYVVAASTLSTALALGGGLLAVVGVIVAGSLDEP